MRLDKLLRLRGVLAPRAVLVCLSMAQWANSEGGAFLYVGDRIAARLRGRCARYEVLDLLISQTPKGQRCHKARLLETRLLSED